METERDLFDKVKRYFLKLGYPNESIFFDYATDDKKRMDVVIKSSDKVLVVIEIKNRSSLNLDVTDEIGYNPLARTLQKAAKELGAKYYVLSNGDEHIWLKTGESGRPEPIIDITYDQFNQNTLSEPEYIKEILHHVAEFLRINSKSQNYLLYISLVLYSKLISELEENASKLPIDFGDAYINNILKADPYNKYQPQQIIEEAIFRLKQGGVELVKHKKAVIQFIDELFKKNNPEWNIPRWLGDFMVKLLNTSSRERIIDLFSKHGVISSSAYLNAKQNVVSCYTNQDDVYWLKIQQLLLTGSEQELRFEPSLVQGRVSSITTENSVDAVLIVPPIGLKIEDQLDTNLFHIGIKDSTSIYLEIALKIVKPNGTVIAIIPDSYLLSSKYKKAREFFKRNNRIESIISLPSQTFIPQSSLKTSIIIIIKAPSLNEKSCIMASIEDVPESDSIDCSETPNLKEVLEKIDNFRHGVGIQSSKSGFLVNFLDVENFHYSKYWFQDNYDGSRNLQHGYLSIPLKEIILNFHRGGPLVANESGEIPFIGPAVIRNMNLRKDLLTYTSKEKIPKSVKKVEEGEIIINAIGTHRGSAALVTKEFDGISINRHVVSIRPNTNIVIPGYLAVALNSNFVQQQFFDKSTGSTIPALNLKSFEEIFIPVPSLEEQETIYYEYKNLISKINQAQNSLTDLESTLNLKLAHLGKEDINS